MISGKPAAPVVFLLRHRLQVRRVHANAVATLVVDREAGRNRPDGEFIGNPVRALGFPFDGEASITVRECPAGPWPTPTRPGRHVDPVPKTFRNWFFATAARPQPALFDVIADVIQRDAKAATNLQGWFAADVVGNKLVDLVRR